MQREQWHCRETHDRHTQQNKRRTHPTRTKRKKKEEKLRAKRERERGKQSDRAAQTTILLTAQKGAHGDNGKRQGSANFPARTEGVIDTSKKQRHSNESERKPKQNPNTQKPYV
jgi:hypothetical protein